MLCGLQELHKYKENEKDTEVLMSALSAMQDKTQHLENSLSAETRIKLDLFSALGDAKRQLEIAQGSYSGVQGGDDFYRKAGFIAVTRCVESPRTVMKSVGSSAPLWKE